MSTEWNGLRFFEALRELGPVRVISRSGPSIFESICSLDGFGVAEGHLTAITPAYHWHVDLARFRHLKSCDAMHERSGRRVLFFELNGQPREVKIADRSLAPAVPPRRKAEDGNPSHIAAPMPGLVSSLEVTPGHHVRKGDRLLSIEAMKMETAIFAERDGLVADLLVTAGTQVDAKDLLLVIEPAGG